MPTIRTDYTYHTDNPINNRKYVDNKVKDIADYIGRIFRNHARYELSRVRRKDTFCITLELSGAGNCINFRVYSQDTVVESMDIYGISNVFEEETIPMGMNKQRVVSQVADLQLKLRKINERLVHYISQNEKWRREKNG